MSSQQRVIGQIWILDSVFLGNEGLPPRSDAMAVPLCVAYPLMEFTSSILVVLIWR
jgi:hypothetical protein